MDTTGIDPIVGTQAPFLPFSVFNYGAMNIPGDVLIDGLSLDKFHYNTAGVRVQPFVSYVNPKPSEELTRLYASSRSQYTCIQLRVHFRQARKSKG